MNGFTDPLIYRAASIPCADHDVDGAVQAILSLGSRPMDEIRTLSHVALLDAYDESIPGTDRERVIRDEILRRLDSARTSQRQDIAPDPEGTQR